jgi:primase-polymerase (primpol)-like protein
MENYKQYINYKLVPRADGHTDKLPVSTRTGQICNAHDPNEWVSRAEATATGLPVAFVFTADDPFVFLDIDGAYINGQWSALAADLCRDFSGAYVEVSQSGKGLHVFFKAPADLPHLNKNAAAGIELYTSGRFVALTGTNAVGSASHTPPVEVYRSLIDTYFPPGVHGSNIAPEWTDAPDPEWRGPEDDAELIRIMLKSKSAKGILGGTATVQQLWSADADALGAIWPDAGGQMRAFDWSSADSSLCSHLAFWTGKDCGRIERLFSVSALADRDKWINRPEYRQATILGAVAGCQNVYKKPQDPPIEVPTQAAGAIGPVATEGYQYAAAQNQLEIFKGCVYVQDEHKVFTPDGLLLKPDQFKATYGGTVFAVDAAGEKTTKNAWEVFTESQAIRFPKANTVCFRPEVQSGAVIEEGGLKIVNTYVPIKTARTAGDPGPFLDLLARLLPVQTDRDIILSYMAACVRYPGVKFQWCPLIQGAPGNGKTLLGMALVNAVGLRYTHMPEAKDIGNKFNAWLQGKLLVVVEEICTRDKLDNIETLKWMITNEIVPRQGKGQDQTTGDNRANFIMFSNHKDAIQKTEKDRRFCVFYTAQQGPEDFTRSGMGGRYFPELWAWAKTGGWAIINNYLHEYEIPDALNPATDCHRAPATSSTQEALIQSLGSIDQIVMEAIGEGRPGFTGGWISTMALDRFLRDRHLTMSMVKRKEMLENLGYVLHPALSDGRVNNPIPMERGKPRLYVRRGHIATNITNAVEVARIYSEQQGYVIAEGGQTAAAILGGK